MVSNGSQFRLYIPAKNRFIEGVNQIGNPSPNKLENLRPQHFLEALLVNPSIPPPSRPCSRTSPTKIIAVYILSIIAPKPVARRFSNGSSGSSGCACRWCANWSSDSAGDILTDARYSDWQKLR